ncbi:U3 small nucleolar RNA-associated protein 14 B-like isoform X2 [Biomphalaria glabrata]|nr:U3 small nucleolar RNA-associated protein 14-like protein B-like isoform X2 [Biomphalaria glabrata]
MADDTNSMDEDELEEEEAIDGVAHQKLINSLFALDGKKNKKQSVTLRTSNISNNLDMAIHASRDTLKIHPQDLKLKQKHVSAQLQKPLSALEMEKTKRKLARETVHSEMTKWEPVVNEIRSATQTAFSNRPHGLQMFQSMQPKSFTPRTPLEQEIYAALGKDESLVKQNQALSVAETKALKAMSVKEALARRAELMKHHTLLSRMELKAKRQKKIKSKRYRKVLQKERVAAEKKELEHLRQNDPGAFLEKIELMEKNRMEERLTLKHKGGGKFSRLHKAYSKFDDKSRDAIQAMLEKSKELTKKLESLSDEEEEEEEEEVNIVKTVESTKTSDSVIDDLMVDSIIKGKFGQLKTSTNMWLNSTNQFQTASTSNSQLASTSNSNADGKNPDIGTCHNVNTHTSSIDTCTDSLPLKVTENLSANSEQSLTAPDKKSQETSEKPKSSDVNVVKKTSVSKKDKKKKCNESNKADISKPVVFLESADQLTVNGDELKVTMEELFEDEDVVEEFSKEKAEMENKNVVKHESKLPGWGSWAGPDYKHIQEKRSKKRSQAQLKDQKVKKPYAPYVWINPNKDQGIRKLLPKSVPFPFSSVRQYELSVSQPVSRGLVPETATKLLTKPEVVTKLGHIIKPLNKEEYMSKKEDIDMEEIKTKSTEFRK